MNEIARAECRKRPLARQVQSAPLAIPPRVAATSSRSYIKFLTFQQMGWQEKAVFLLHSVHAEYPFDKDPLIKQGSI